MGREGVPSSSDRPLRTCVGCRRRYPKRHLVRFAVKDGTIVADTSQQLPGRGAYLCWNAECARRVLDDGRRLVHALRTRNDHVTVNSRTLLQDWEANRRHRRDGTANDDARKATSAVSPPTVHGALGDNT